MSTQDDDATVTQLAGAWVALSEGGDKRQEALNIFQDLGEKYNMSLLLTNAIALVHLHMGQFDEAERLLQDGLSKNATGTLPPFFALPARLARLDLRRFWPSHYSLPCTRGVRSRYARQHGRLYDSFEQAERANCSLPQPATCGVSRTSMGREVL